MEANGGTALQMMIRARKDKEVINHDDDDDGYVRDGVIIKSYSGCTLEAKEPCTSDFTPPKNTQTCRPTANLSVLGKLPCAHARSLTLCPLTPLQDAVITLDSGDSDGLMAVPFDGR